MSTLGVLALSVPIAGVLSYVLIRNTPQPDFAGARRRMAKVKADRAAGRDPRERRDGSTDPA